MVDIVKNRDRNKKTFANINLLGKCNADCYFCLGKDIEKELCGKNHLNVHFIDWKNFFVFLEKCKEEGIDKLYFTGQTADGLQYKYLADAVRYLQGVGFEVGLRTNGYLAERKMDIISDMNGEIGYSIHSLNPVTNLKIMGREDIPNWDRILSNSGDNVRVSIVLNRYNANEFDGLLRYLSGFKAVKYIQIRRISTDTRVELLQEDIDLYEQFYLEFSREHKQIGNFYLAEQYNVHGKEVNFWRTVETSCDSLNYFTDGTVSDEYFIVEGYLKHMNK